MPIITIDNKPYELDNLSNDAKAQLEMLLATDAEIKRLQQNLAMSQTARNAYAKALQAALPSLPQSDTVKLG